jgi:dTDP-4-dehydrorhamnose reductase
MNPSIFLLGKDGQVGWELQRSLSPLGNLIAHNRKECDVGDIDLLRAILAARAPDIIVNAAAYTAVDKAEQDSATANRINADATAVMAEVANRNGSLLVHYSTDHVFDGAKSSTYTEEDATNPISIYGRSKVLGEQAIIDSGCRHLIFRTSWVFSARANNFTKTMLRLASERENVCAVVDQFGTPTSAELIADVTAHVIRDVIADRAPGGLYHLAAAGETSRHGYASFVFEQAQQLGIPLKTYSAAPIATSEYPLPAARPSNSRLDTTKLQNTFGLTMPDWRHHVARLIQELSGAIR